ncbi:MAG: potassium transporter TrkG [bacterium]|nr:potassium transporter TrkG [bacterium]
MHIKTVLLSLGGLLKLLSLVMLLPVGIAFLYHEDDWKVFLISAIVVFLSGIFFSWIYGEEQEVKLKVREGFALVTFSWLATVGFGALPYWLGGTFTNFIDALFESTSGFTTTGASVLIDIEAQSKAILFWRSFTHWLGGMGIIVLAVAILPQLSVGGMQMMKAEAPGHLAERLRPRIAAMAKRLWGIYLLLSTVQVAALYLAGMPLYDSFCHMFGTMGTGGFSTKTDSIAAYHSPTIEFIIIIFMFLAATNFALHYRIATGQFNQVFKNGEFRFYLIVMAAASLVVTFTLWPKVYSLGEAIRYALFQVVSLGTTTGFMTADFDTWPPLAKGILFLLLFTGGCAGSTSGAIKQVRIIILLKKAYQSLRQMLHPQAVIPLRLGDKVIPPDVISGITNFFLLYLFLFVAFTLILLGLGLDLVSAASAIAATMGGVGPGLGLVGPAENYAFLPDIGKIVLVLSMILGRLEIFTVLVLFLPSAWRK